MPLNTNIYAQFAPQAKSTQDYLDEYDARDMRDQQNKLNALGLQEKQRASERQNKLYALMDGLPADISDEKRSAVLKSGGFFDQADALDKNSIARTNAKVEGQAKQAKALTDFMTVQRDLSTAVMAQPTVENALMAVRRAAQYHKMLGFGDADTTADEQALSKMTSPDEIKQWAAGHALEAAKLLPQNVHFSAGGREVNQAVNPVTGAVTLTGSTAFSQSPDNAATQATARRGQDLTDTRARDFNATQGNTYDPERGVVVNTRTQTATPVTANGQPLKAKDKPMTEGQAKANLFGTRAQASNQILNDLAGGVDGKGTDGVNQPGMINRMAASIPFIGEGAQTATNWTQSDKQQQVSQAQRDFLNAVLRRESGAVIGADEFTSGSKQYFPQPGDSKAVLAQKANNRKLAIEGILAEVPGRPAPSAGSPFRYIGTEAQ